MPDASGAGFNPVGLLFSFEGRISRRWFWIGTLMVGAIVYGVRLLVERAHESRGDAQNQTFLLAAAILAGGYPAAAIATKRLHDRGKSGWWCLIYGVIPLFLHWLALQIQAPDANGPGLAAITCNTVALAIWLFALVDLGVLKGVVTQPSRTAT